MFTSTLPLTTAVFDVLRGGERPRLAFRPFSIAGRVLVVGFEAFQSPGPSLAGDLLMTASIILCGLGYAEGATLFRRMSGWLVISWALLLALSVRNYFIAI